MARKTLSETHEHALRLDEYRLDFLFRNKALKRLAEDYIRTQDKLHRFYDELVAQYGRKELDKKPEETDPDGLKELKMGREEVFIELSSQETEIVEFLKSFGVHTDSFLIRMDFIFDYYKNLLKSGKIEQYPERITRDYFNRLEEKTYVLNAYVPGVKAVVRRRLIRTKDFEEVTGYKLRTRRYNVNMKQASAKYDMEILPIIKKEILPIITKNYGRLPWKSERSFDHTFWLSRNPDQDDISQEKNRLEYSEGVYCADTGRFYSVLTNLIPHGSTEWALVPVGIDEARLLEHKQILNIKVDVTRTKDYLLSEFEGLVNYFKSVVLTDESVAARRTQEVALYDKYLRVWDLVQQKGRKWTEIAKQVFPGDADPEGARVKVEQYYDRSCKLIDEGLP